VCGVVLLEVVERKPNVGDKPAVRLNEGTVNRSEPPSLHCVTDAVELGSRAPPNKFLYHLLVPHVATLDDVPHLVRTSAKSRNSFVSRVVHLQPNRRERRRRGRREGIQSVVGLERIKSRLKRMKGVFGLKRMKGVFGLKRMKGVFGLKRMKGVFGLKRIEDRL